MTQTQAGKLGQAQRQHELDSQLCRFRILSKGHQQALFEIKIEQLWVKRCPTGVCRELLRTGNVQSLLCGQQDCQMTAQKQPASPIRCRSSMGHEIFTPGHSPF